MNEPHDAHRSSVLPAIAISAAAVLISVAPLLARGFGMGHDWIFELVRIAEFRQALRDGQWPPYWAPNLYAGFGSPIFLFYPPLYLAVAAVLAAFGVETATAAVGALCAFSVVGAILMWRFVRGVSPQSPAAAAIGVVLFSLHPYLLADKWIRNANAEFAALALLPGVLIGATANTPRRAFWWTAGSLALVILSHNIVALVAVTLSVGMTLFVHRSARAIVPVLAGISSALALTAFFWVPAFALQPLIRTEDLLSGKFDFHTQFPAIVALVWPTEFYSGGWLTPLLLAIALFAPAADRRARRTARALAIGGVCCVILMLPVSTPLWETLPLLRFAQFPWRFMGPLGVLLAAAAAVLAASTLRGRWQLAAAVGILVLAGANSIPALRQFEPLAPEFEGRIEPALSPEAIRSKDLRTTVQDEYLPRGADLNAVREMEGHRLFKKWSFPVWTATRAGQEVPVEAGPGGVVAVRVDSEADEVVLSTREPAVRRVAKMFSLAAAAVLALLAFSDRFHGLRKAAGQ